MLMSARLAKLNACKKEEAFMTLIRQTTRRQEVNPVGTTMPLLPPSLSHCSVSFVCSPAVWRQSHSRKELLITETHLERSTSEKEKNGHFRHLDGWKEGRPARQAMMQAAKAVVRKVDGYPFFDLVSRSAKLMDLLFCSQEG